jgi:hypothetical protein
MSIHRGFFRAFRGLGLAAALTLPASVAVAAPSAHTTTHEVHVGCDLLTAQGVNAYLVATALEGGSGADLQVWMPPANPVFEPPTLVGGDASLVMSGDGSRITGGVELIDTNSGDTVGTALLTASLESAGPAETVERSTVGSNQKQRVVETHLPLTVSGTLNLPTGEAFDLDGLCSGQAITTQTFANAPTSTVTSTDFIGLACDWYLTDGSYVGLIGQSDQLTSWLDIAVVTPDGSFPDPDGAASLTLTRSRIEGSFELAPPGQGIAPTGGTAYATARVWNGERVVTAEGEASRRSRTTIQGLVVDGTLTVSLDDGTSYVLPMNAETCRMADISHRTIEGGND